MSGFDWDDVEPAVVLAEFLTCNGTTVAGGALMHTRRCPVHGVVAELQADEAERRGHAAGYAEAVARLRDDGRWLAFLKANDQALYLEDNLLAAAFLEAEATKETTDHA